MPYTRTPLWAKWTLYGLRFALYLALLASGVGAVWLTPATLSTRLPTFITDLWGALAVAGAVVALYGAATLRYRWEVSALPFIAAAVLIYAATIWDITATTPTRLAQASAITALLFALLIRYVDLLVVSIRERRDHHREQEA